MKIKKYKGLSLKNILFYGNLPFPRILKFKRSKWKKLIKILTKKKLPLKRRRFKNLKFFNFNKIFVKLNFWERCKKFYKKGLTFKKSIEIYFSGTFGLKKTKKIVQLKKNVFLSLFFSCFYRLDTLLWVLKLISSKRAARQAINSKKILINGIVAKNNVALKKGDIITFCDDFIFKKSISKIKSAVFPFCEIDFYLNNLIILKNMNELSYRELSFIFREKFQIKFLLFYLKRK